MIPIKDNYKFDMDPTMEDQIRRTNNWIYQTKKSNLDRPSVPGEHCQKIAVSIPTQEVYLVKNVVRLTTTMEGSNYLGYGYKTQHSYPRSRLITWRRPEMKFGRNLVKKKQHKNY